MFNRWKIRLNWYSVALIAILAVTLIASYYLPDEARSELRADAGYVWGILATFLGPLLRRELAGAETPPKGKK